MALARLALKSMQQRVLSSPSNVSSMLGRSAVSEKAIGGVQRQSWKNNELVKKFATAASDKASDEKSAERKEVSVSEGKKSKLFPRRHRNRGLWRNNDRDFVPALYGTHSLSLQLSLKFAK